MDVRRPDSRFQVFTGYCGWIREQGRLVTTLEMINQDQGFFTTEEKLSHLFSALQSIKLGSLAFVR